MPSDMDGLEVAPNFGVPAYMLRDVEDSAAIARLTLREWRYRVMLLWPEPQRTKGRGILADAHSDLMACQPEYIPLVIKDVKNTLAAIEEELRDAE